MANTKDPIMTIAEMIVESAKDIAQAQVGKAHYDKSYKSKIIGVNQSFTDDLTEEEQKELVKKYSIPEETEDDEPNYYTFKVLGVPYCLTSNTDFMLYENVIIRCPNGDFDEMFIEGERKGGETYIPNQLFVSADEPQNTDTQTIKENDYWVQTYSENLKVATAFYRYERAVDENGEQKKDENGEEIGYEWVLLFYGVKLGVGLAFNANGEICLDVEPVINITNAVYTVPTDL